MTRFHGSLAVSARLLAFLCCIAFAAACNEGSDGAALASEGAKTASTLEQYYATLAQTVDRTIDLEAFSDSERGIPAEQNKAETELEHTANAMRAREAMAHRLGETYQALSALASYDATGEVNTATASLTGSVKALPRLSQGPDPSSVFGELAGDIVARKQRHSMLRQVHALVATTDGLEKLFTAESPAYASIGSDYALQARSVAGYLIDGNLVSPEPLLAEVPATLDLAWVKDDAPMTDAASKAAVKALMDVRTRRLQNAATEATSAQGNALHSLNEAQQDFLKKQPFSLGDLQAQLARASSLLDEIQTMLTKPDAKETKHE